MFPGLVLPLLILSTDGPLAASKPLMVTGEALTTAATADVVFAATAAASAVVVAVVVVAVVAAFARKIAKRSYHGQQY